MKRLTVILFAVVLGFAFLSTPSISEARGGHGGGGHGGGGGFHGGYSGGFRGGYSGGGYRVAAPSRGYSGGYHGGYYGGYRGAYYGGYRGGYYGRGFYPYWGFGLGWGLWGWPLLGWAYAGWPYYSYGGYPYLGWPYYSSAYPSGVGMAYQESTPAYSQPEQQQPYYPSEVTEAPPAYSKPEQQQPYYWYFCQNPQGYYPYVKSCPGGWMTVIPKVTPPPPPTGFTPSPSGAYPPPATGEPGPGNISPPPTTSQITPNPNQKRCQIWTPTGEFHNESSWNPQNQMMETVSVPNFAWQDIPCK